MDDDYTFKVTGVSPEDRAHDVLHWLTTGELFEGRSLHNVKFTVELLSEDYEYSGTDFVH